MTIERTVKLATIVDTIEEAFAFVVNRIDEEKMEIPHIIITPIWIISNDREDRQRYEVSVSNMKEDGG